MTEWPIIAVLCGGPSGEREVSLQSGHAVAEALAGEGLEVRLIDVDPRHLATQVQDSGAGIAFNVCHGSYGEDGLLQAQLQVLKMPVTGSGVLASALSMDKWRSKRLWQAAGLPTTQGVLLRHDEALPATVQGWGWPCFTKPNRAGSSLGVSRVTDAHALEQALGAAFAIDDEVLIEAAVLGQEVTVGIINGQALPPIVIQASGAFYDYHAKYVAADTRYLLPSGLGAKLEQQLQALALRAFAELGGTNWGRVDLLLDHEQQPYLLEINSVPGMTSHSLIPMAARAAGWDMGPLCVEILRGVRRTHHG